MSLFFAWMSLLPFGTLPPHRPRRFVPLELELGDWVKIAPLFDELICLSQPEQFVNAGFWYADFSRPGDEVVGEMLC